MTQLITSSVIGNTGGSVAPLIKEYYPEYYLWGKYPVGQSIPIRKTKEKWGVLGNFHPTPLVVEGLRFRCSEQLFQVLKFTDKEVIRSILSKRGLPLKWEARKWEKLGYRRHDWGKVIIDVMKFCLQTKYDQSEEFRKALADTEGLSIVEDQSNMKRLKKAGTTKPADTWGVVREGESYVGSNLLGRLLMELRDKRRFSFSLPPDFLIPFRNIDNNNP